ncbi:MAG: DUF4114 domain-containing protein [Herminiimonas sp.]|nr:DUF4114 domain-containing protein [Herminiimonas sp.]
MSESISRIESESLSQESLKADKATPPPVKSISQAASQPVVATKSASVVALGKSPAELGLYGANGSAATPAATKTGGTANSDGSYTTGKDAVSITIEKSDSGYNNKIYFSTDNFKTRQLVGIDNQTGTINIGSFAAGTKIDFGIDNGQGDFFRTGGASANSDNFQHMQSSAVAGGGQQVGFEDLRGGGDRDFNDAIITVRNVPAAEVKDNRSGLGDGSNPGKGSGTANSPNTGTLNPSAVKTPAAAPDSVPAIAKPAPAVPVVGAPQVAQIAIPKPASASIVSAANPAPVAIPSVAKPLVAVAAVMAKPVAIPVVAVAKPFIPVAPPVAPAKTAVITASPEKDNRSGLGDGTNPGKGSGTVTSPNTGTLNPSAAKSPAAVSPVVAKLVATAVAAPAKPLTPAALSVAVKAPTVATAAQKDNRSGLGDGTNPGVGEGRVNSPNTGTVNPSGAVSAPTNTAASVKKTEEATQVKITGGTVDRKVEAALQAYQVPQAQKFMTNVQV